MSARQFRMVDRKKAPCGGPSLFCMPPVDQETGSSELYLYVSTVGAPVIIGRSFFSIAEYVVVSYFFAESAFVQRLIATT